MACDWSKGEGGVLRRYRHISPMYCIIVAFEAVAEAKKVLGEKWWERIVVAPACKTTEMLRMVAELW